MADPKPKPKPKQKPRPRGAGQAHALNRKEAAARAARVRARKPAEQKGEGAYQPRRPKQSQESKAAALTSLGKVRSGSDTGAVRIIMDSQLSDAKKREALRILGRGKGGPKEG
jgi:hypothetical protein